MNLTPFLMITTPVSFRCALNGIILTIAAVLLNGCSKPAPEAAIVVNNTQTTETLVPEKIVAKVSASESGLFAELKQLSAAELSLDSASSKNYLEKYFKNECSKSDERLPFEQTCQHYSDAALQDPSPWPDLMIGVKNKKITSAVLFSAEQSLGENWQCDKSKQFENMRYCYFGKTTVADREQWSKQWSAYFATAD